MKLPFRYSLLAALMITAMPNQAQRFTTTGNASEASLESPIYNNVLLRPTQTTRISVSKSAGTTSFNTGTQGQVFSTNAFSSRRRGLTGSGMAMTGSSAATGTYSGFTNISAYQNISVSDISTPSPRKVIGPPPPTPNPDDPHVLPVGDAWWLVLLMALGYATSILFRRRKAHDN